MVACEVSDSVLAALLQTNDDLVAAVSSWEGTASRLAMQQSRSTAPAASNSRGSAASSCMTSSTPEMSDSSNSSTSGPAAQSGLFWSSAIAPGPSAQLAAAPPQQALHLQQQQGLHAPHVPYKPGAGRDKGGGRRQDPALDMPSSASFLDDLAGSQPQYPHQPASPGHHGGAAGWDAFGSRASMAAASPSEPMVGGPQPQAGALSGAEPAQEFHGSVLRYRLAEPQQMQESPAEPGPASMREGGSDGLQGQGVGSAPWGWGEAGPSDQHMAHEAADPFAGRLPC